MFQFLPRLPKLEVSIGLYITFLLLLQQIATNLVVDNNTHLLFYRSGGQSWKWVSRAVFLLEALGENLFPFIF